MRKTRTAANSANIIPFISSPFLCIRALADGHRVAPVNTLKAIPYPSIYIAVFFKLAKKCMIIAAREDIATKS